MDCRWQAALRIMLSALGADIVAYHGSLAPDAGAALGGAAPEQKVNQKYMSGFTICLTQMSFVGESKKDVMWHPQLPACKVSALNESSLPGSAKMMAALSAGNPRHARHEGCPFRSAWTAAPHGCNHQAL